MVSRERWGAAPGTWPEASPSPCGPKEGCGLATFFELAEIVTNQAQLVIKRT